MLNPNLQQRRAERIGDRVIGADKNYGTHRDGPLNPHSQPAAPFYALPPTPSYFNAPSSAGYGQDMSREAQRVLQLFYPNSTKSRGR